MIAPRELDWLARETWARTDQEEAAAIRRQRVRLSHVAQSAIRALRALRQLANQIFWWLF